MKAHGSCAGYALKGVSHPDLQAVNSALEMWFKARVSHERSEVLSQGWVFAQGPVCSAFPWVLLPQSDIARLNGLRVTTLLLFALVNDMLKPNLPKFNYK